MKGMSADFKAGPGCRGSVRISVCEAELVNHSANQKKTNLRLKRKAAAWDDDFRVNTMGLIRL